MASENGQNLEVSIILLHAGADVENPDKKGLGFFKYSFQPVLHDWCNKGLCVCYPVCGIVHIKEPLLLIGKSSPCGGSGFPLSLSEWSFTICPTPYNRKIKCVECIVKQNISFLHFYQAATSIKMSNLLGHVTLA